VTIERPRPKPPNSVWNRWCPFVAIPAPARAVTWRQFSWDNRCVQQFGIELRWKRAPWRALLATLDDLGRGMEDSPVPVEDEADAIVACCWRYGSYVDILTGGELFPPFRSDTSLSRLGDREMQRINLEYSSGEAAWLGDREQAASRVRRRREANGAVNSTYRYGPIENFHAGTWSQGSKIPGFMRCYPGEVRRLAGDAAAKMTAHLIWREQGAPDLRRLLQTVMAPSAWSVTAETSNVRFSGLAGLGPPAGTPSAASSAGSSSSCSRPHWAMASRLRAPQRDATTQSCNSVAKGNGGWSGRQPVDRREWVTPSRPPLGSPALPILLRETASPSPPSAQTTTIRGSRYPTRVANR
jgi:hypothetical protein